METFQSSLRVSTVMLCAAMFMRVMSMPFAPHSSRFLHGCPEAVNVSCLLFLTFPTKSLSLCFHTWAGQVQLSLAKPQLGTVNGAGVELNSEHHLPLRRPAPPVVALHLQAVEHSSSYLTFYSEIALKKTTTFTWEWRCNELNHFLLLLCYSIMSVVWQCAAAMEIGCLRQTMRVHLGCRGFWTTCND